MSQKGDLPIIFVRNLSYEITSGELYDLFGKYGAISQIRKGVETSTKGTAFVIYQTLQSAKLAIEKLSGFNFNGRYLIVSMFSADRQKLREGTIEQREKHLEQLKEENGIE